jgi:tRNA (guanosine-2'-O-)-methyltransferase
VWEKKYQFRRGTAMGSQQWVRQTNHDNINNAMAELKGQGMQVLLMRRKPLPIKTLLFL